MRQLLQVDILKSVVYQRLNLSNLVPFYSNIKNRPGVTYRICDTIFKTVTIMLNYCLLGTGNGRGLE